MPRPRPNFLSDNLGEIAAGQPLAQSMTRGPVQPATMEPPPPTNAAGTPYATWWATWNATLQDYRQFGIPHGRSCQIVFADGSVRALADTTKDDLLNNGFPPDAASGFTDDTQELSPYEVFSRWRLSQE